MTRTDIPFDPGCLWTANGRASLHRDPIARVPRLSPRDADGRPDGSEPPGSGAMDYDQGFQRTLIGNAPFGSAGF